jgi:hypothetical protein
MRVQSVTCIILNGSSHTSVKAVLMAYFYRIRFLAQAYRSSFICPIKVDQVAVK